MRIDFACCRHLLLVFHGGHVCHDIGEYRVACAVDAAFTVNGRTEVFFRQVEAGKRLWDDECQLLFSDEVVFAQVDPRKIMQVVKSALERCFCFFPFPIKVEIEKQTLLSSKKTFSGVMLLYSAFPPPLAEALSSEMNSP